MAILFVLLIPIAIVLFVLFDVILYLEHEDHIEEWEKDGRPGGFFWRPEGVSAWAGSSVEAALHPLGCFQLQHGWRQIRERSAFCFGIVRYGGSQ